MKSMLYYNGIYPILDIEEDVSAGKPARFGVYRERCSNACYDEIHRVNMEFKANYIGKTTISEGAWKQRLIEDLAYVYGSNPEKFTERCEFFEIF